MTSFVGKYASTMDRIWDRKSMKKLWRCVDLGHDLHMIYKWCMFHVDAIFFEGYPQKMAWFTGWRTIVPKVVTNQQMRSSQAKTEVDG